MIMDTPKIKPDPLNFKDSKKYVDRLKTAQKNQTNDSVIVASGTMNGKKLLLQFLILILWVVLWVWQRVKQLLQHVNLQKKSLAFNNF